MTMQRPGCPIYRPNTSTARQVMTRTRLNEVDEVVDSEGSTWDAD